MARAHGWSWVRQLGTTSLLVYWVHIELVYGRWFGFWKENLTIAQCALAAITLILAMIGLSYIRTNWKWPEMRLGDVSATGTPTRFRRLKFYLQWWIVMRFLVVEDEQRIADFLKRGLESAGYAVDTAQDGKSAIELIHATDYDLIILDMMLPDMDGLRVLERVRNRKTSPPVLILSARGTVDDRVKGLELGADDYLVKPFAFVELLARVRVLLRRGAPLPNGCKSAILSWTASGAA